MENWLATSVRLKNVIPPTKPSLLEINKKIKIKIKKEKKSLSPTNHQLSSVDR
jgi:hypothetical protein